MGRKIFLSYAHKNAEDAKKLRAKLEERDYDVWIDKRIRGGDDWRQEIDEALETITDLVVLLTPESADSEWVTQEVHAAKYTDKKIHPILVKEFENRAYPLWAQDIQHYDFCNQPYQKAFEELCATLKPPHPIQKLLDDRLDIYEKTGVFLSEEDLLKIEAAKDDLDLSRADELIKKSKKYYRNKWKYFLIGTLLGGATSVLPFALKGKSYIGLTSTFYAVLFLIGGSGGYIYMLGRETILRKVQDYWSRLLYGGLLLFIALTITLTFFSSIVYSTESQKWARYGLSGGGLGFFLGISIEAFIVWKSQKTHKKKQDKVNKSEK